MLSDIIHVFLHLDQYLATWAVMMGPWLYVVLFLIVFAETGLVVTPFLPGDSLLFALGALTSLTEGGLSLGILSVLLVVAALLGDNVNYRVGNYLGPRVFQKEKSFFFSRKHLERTQEFYNKYGAQAVIMARFVPIVRTFVPFVAGVGRMYFPKYLSYSVIGAVLWTQIFLWAGHLFGDTPFVKRNFHIVIFAVIILSVLPMVAGYFMSLRQKKAANSL